MHRTAAIAILVALGLPAGHARAQSGGTPSGALAEVRQLENAMHQYWRHREFDAMRALMAPEATFSGDAGWQTRDQVIASMKAESCTAESVALDVVKATALGPDAVLITYQVAVVGTCNGVAIPKSLQSSVWVRRAGGWLTLFHHYSPLK
jgi:hypothetical protein